MKKWLFGVVLYSFLLCLCANAYAVEPSVIDYEGFAVYLQERGITIPRTLEEAIGDEGLIDPPKYELIVDEENDQYILRTDLKDVDAYICIFSNDMEYDRVFMKTDEPGVYVAKGIGNPSDLYISVNNKMDPDAYDIECYFDLEKSGSCNSLLHEYFLTNTICVWKRIANSGDGTGTFEYAIGKKAYINNDWYYEERLALDFSVPTGELKRVAYEKRRDSKDFLYVTFINKSLTSLRLDDYSYSIYDGWKKDGDPCDPPFELTPELYPYPSFLP